MITHHVFVPDALGTHCAWSRNTRDDVPICGAAREEHVALAHDYVAGPITDRCYHWYSASDSHAGFFCTAPGNALVHVGAERPALLGSAPPVRSDYERALERIKELEQEAVGLRAQRQILIDSERKLSAELNHMTASRRFEAEENVRLQKAVLALTSDASLAQSGYSQLHARAEELDALVTTLQDEKTRLQAENAKLSARLNSLDALAREVSSRVTKIMGIVLEP